MKNFADRKTTIKDHVNYLKSVNKETYNQMMVELAEIGKLAYFTKTLLVFHTKDLRNVHGPVMNIIIKYLGFSEDNFKKNIVPELTKLEAA
ncbi:hypothetical protein [Emticicia sp. W12TSBA100-4]|uniref:hypothetical protein n=1 Tax=Emticicia sp. W12TSBA100-4 TaxID=3160965 RepID=UPI0033063714